MAFGMSRNNPGTSVGSKATSSATNKAANVALGSNGARVTDSMPTRSTRPLGSVRNSIHPGSKAGLNNESIVHLQHGGSGYMNPSNQLARFARKIPLPQPSIGRSPFAARSGSKIFDSRLCRTNGSISKLNKLL